MNECVPHHYSKSRSLTNHIEKPTKRHITARSLVASKRDDRALGPNSCLKCIFRSCFFELFFLLTSDRQTVQAVGVHSLASAHNGLRTAFPKEHPTGHPYTGHSTPLDSRLQSAVA